MRLLDFGVRQAERSRGFFLQLAQADIVALKA